MKYELQHILSGEGKVKYGDIIQTIVHFLKRSQETSGMAEKKQSSKKQEEKKLIKWIEDNGFWYSEIDFTKFVSEGAEQKVYLNGNEDVIKLNGAIYYASWTDYFHNLLLNNYFFPDTAYQLLGFYLDNQTLYAVVKQKYVKATEHTQLENVKLFLENNGFEVIRNNDYINKDLGIILEDLHDENVLTTNGVLAFIDTVFYVNEDFWKQ